jgi:CRP-like cAMP-binding protein
MHLTKMFCESLSDAYDQLKTLASSDTVHQLVRVLLRLGTQLGHTSGQMTELSAYLTQEEISQMVVARRERVSTAILITLKPLRAAPTLHMIVPANFDENYWATHC